MPNDKRLFPDRPGDKHPPGLYITRDFGVAAGYAQTAAVRAGKDTMLIVGIKYNPKRTDAVLEWIAVKKLIDFIVWEQRSYIGDLGQSKPVRVINKVTNLVFKHMLTVYSGCETVVLKHKKTLLKIIKRMVKNYVEHKYKGNAKTQTRFLAEKIVNMLRRCTTKLKNTLTLKLTKPVGFSGKTRIVLIVELPINYDDYVPLTPKELKQIVTEENPKDALNEHYDSFIVYPKANKPLREKYAKMLLYKLTSTIIKRNHI